MKTLKQLIEKGKKDIVESNSETIYAAIYMAYQAGISKGDIGLRNEFIEKITNSIQKSKNERYHKVALKHIPAAPKEIIAPEYEEILDFEYSI